MSLLSVTPVRHLFPRIAETLCAIAPERLSELEVRAADVVFELTDEHPLGFASTFQDRRIFVSRRGVEYLWALSYFAWVLHSRYIPNSSLPQELLFADDPATSSLPLLLGWALHNQTHAAYILWPDDVPQPRDLANFVADDPAFDRVASELALCATGWILHHELAHIANQDVPDSPASLQQERRADREATEWLLSKAPLGTATIKRGLGIVVGSVALAGAELFGPPPTSSFRTHPDVASRIFAALDHPGLEAYSVVHDIASILLKAVLDRAKIQTSVGPFSSSKEALSQYCRELQDALRAREASGAV
jgi:hypothetical protein